MTGSTKFHALLRYHSTYIYNKLSIADDLIQDAFVKVMERMSLLQSLDAEKRASYLSSTIRNISLNYVKRRFNKLNREYSQAPENWIENIADEHVSLESSYLLHENCLQLRQAISQLSARDQTLLHLKYFLELSDKELAAKLTTSEKNIRSYLTRARRRAYKQYTRHPPDLHAQANCSRLNISE